MYMEIKLNLSTEIVKQFYFGMFAFWAWEERRQISPSERERYSRDIIKKDN